MKLVGLKIPALLLGILIIYHTVVPEISYYYEQLDKEFWRNFVNVINCSLFLCVGILVLFLTQGEQKETLTKIKIFFKCFFIPFFSIKLFLSVITYLKINPMKDEFWPYVWVGIYMILFAISIWKIIRVKDNWFYEGNYK